MLGKEKYMDLRMVKTREQIKNAFLTLREKLMPEKIKVKDICDMAMINKTTFYNHYTDSMQLSNEIDELAIDKIVDKFEQKDKLLEDPKAYMLGLMKALERDRDELKIVFRGKQEILCAKLEEKLQSFCKSASIDDDVRASFYMGGFIHVLINFIFSDIKYDEEQLKQAVERMMEVLNINKKSAPRYM